MGRAAVERLWTETGESADRSPERRASEIGDLRFCALLPAQDWRSLPNAVRQRFTKRLAGGRTVVYTGRIATMRRNFAGKLLAQALRLLGAPLPLASDVDVPSVISVTEDIASGGQNWTRLYANRTCFPQIIHSAKRFSGPTGLEEYLGRGLSMALAVSVENGALTFQDAGYAFSLFGKRMAIPKLLHPGRLTVRHRDLGDGTFEFSLALKHRLFGELLYQAGRYEDQR